MVDLIFSLVLSVAGGVLLLGSIFNWAWIFSGSKRGIFGLFSLLAERIGHIATRILYGISGTLLIAMGLVVTILL